MARVLIAGESWTTTSIHVKGFDSFTTVSYEEGVGALRDALLGAGHEITFLPNHVAATDFPFSSRELETWDVVLLSDIGSNTLLVPPATFARQWQATAPPRPENYPDGRRKAVLTDLRESPS